MTTLATTKKFWINDCQQVIKSFEGPCDEIVKDDIEDFIKSYKSCIEEINKAKTEEEVLLAVENRDFNTKNLM